MSKKQFVLLVILITIIVWTADLLVGNYLSARLATSSFARKFNLFNPQAPIVVTNRETVRVNSNNDVVQTAENSKSKVATVIYFEDDQLITSGSAVNWTSDGYFVTVKSAMAVEDKVYAVVTQQGDLYPIEQVYPDPASELVILQTSARNLAVLDPAESADLRVGEQVVSLLNSLGNGQTKFSTGFIKQLPSDTAGAVHESDLVSRKLQLQITDVTSGAGILNLSGRLIGIWDGSAVVTAQEVRQLVNNFLADNKVIIRPSLGFSYQMLSESEAKALQTVSGARIMGLATGKPAVLAGLKVGDVIVSMDNQKVELSRNIDAQLRAFKPGEVISLEINRKGITQVLDVTSGTLR